MKHAPENFVYGMHTVAAILKHTPERAKKLILARKSDVNELEALVRKHRVPSEFWDRAKLENTFGVGSDAQGVVLLCTPFSYCDVDELINSAKNILVLDTWQDSANIGRAARAALCFGAQGIIICKDRAAGITNAAEKSAVGALAQIPVARVTNLATTLSKLKDAHFFVYGADADGEVALNKCDFASRVALVIGQEGEGLRELTKKRCDVLVHIPMANKEICLNAGDTALVLLYELARRAF